MLAEIFFAYFAVVIVLTSILVIASRNPVHSVLWMLLLFFHIAGLYLMLDAEFLAAIQIIIYAGAILVLFLFVVLLLNLKEEIKGRPFSRIFVIALVLAIGMAVVISSTMKLLPPGPVGQYSMDMIRATKGGNSSIIGRVMYTEFLFPFEIASTILLVAIIGAIVLAKKRLRS